MGDLATLPTIADATEYDAADFMAFFSALTIVAGAVTTNKLADGAVTKAKMESIAQYQILARTTAGSGAPEAISGSANVLALLQAADYSAMRTLLSLRPGTDIQGYDSDLAAIAALTTDAWGRGWLEIANASAARSYLGVLGSNLEHSITGFTEPGSLGTDLIYSTGPTLTITAGTWLIWGNAAMRTNDTAGEFWLGLRDTTNNVDFGKGATCKNESLAVIHQMSCLGFITVTGNTTIRLKGFISGSHTLEFGSVAGISGAIRAVRLNT